VALEMASTVPIKGWAQKHLPVDNELLDAILSEPDMAPRVEVIAKLDAYSKMLDSKVRRIKAPRGATS